MFQIRLSVFCFLLALLLGEVFSEVKGLNLTGMLDATKIEGVDTTGKSDSTAGLNQAIKTSAKENKTLFLPSGTYLISDTLICESIAGAHNGLGAVTLIGSALHKPIIVLQKKANGFSDPAHPKAMIWGYCYYSKEKGGKLEIMPPMLFRSGFRNLILDLGEGNTGAVGIDFNSAQDCFIEDVTVYARDGYAGLTGLPGRGSLTGNVEVSGGQYGIQSKTVAPFLLNITLKDQIQAALSLSCWRGTSLVGLKIMNAKNVGIETSGTSAEAGNLSIVESSIEMASGSGPMITIPNQRSLQLLEVYVKGSKRIIEQPKEPLLTESTGWTRIENYSYVPEKIDSLIAVNVVSGASLTDNQDTFSKISPVNSVPVNLFTKNIWSRTPSFEDPEAMILQSTGKDDRALIQSALDSGKPVYLSAGTFLISAPIVLHSNSILMGVPGLWSVLKPTWVPTSPSWVIDTDDSAQGKALLQDIAMDPPNINFLGSLRWRLGRESSVRRVRGWFAAAKVELAIHNYELTGNGGGKWFNLLDHASPFKKATTPADPNYRKVFISKTTEPVSFYGLNLEHGGGTGRVKHQEPFLEAVGSKNIRTFGSKFESDGTALLFKDCQNVFVSSAMGLTTKFPDDSPLIRLVNTKDILIHNVYQMEQPSYPLLIDELTQFTLSRAHFLGSYRAGLFDNSVFP